MALAGLVTAIAAHNSVCGSTGTHVCKAQVMCECPPDSCCMLGTHLLLTHQATSGPYSTAMQVPEEWDIPPSTTASSSTVDSSTATQQALQPAVQPGSQPLPQQQGTAINSREGASRDTIAGTDTAKTTPAVKNSAGKGWRGGVWLLQSAVAGAVLLLLL